MGIAYRGQCQEVHQMYFYSISKESCKVSVACLHFSMGESWSIGMVSTLLGPQQANVDSYISKFCLSFI